MRITFVLPELNLNGGTRVVAIYAAEMFRRGHIVNVFARPPRPASLSTRIVSWIRAPKSLERPNVRQSHFDGSPVECMLLESWRPVEDKDVPPSDVVIATWWETAEWVNKFSEEKGAKVYFVQHHEVFPYLPVERCHATYRLPFHKIVVARWLKDVMSRYYDDNDVDVVPNSVDKKQFFSEPRRKSQTPKVGLLYSRSEFKGVPTALAAIDLARKRVPELNIVAFGDGPVSASLPLPKGAEFFQAPNQDRLRNIYSECDVWLTASTTEGFNLCAMEAMACRTPVVSTRAGWPEEAIRSGWNGWLAKVGDVNELARGIEWAVSQSPEGWQQISENAFATVSDSSWSASADLFEAALERARRKQK